MAHNGQARKSLWIETKGNLGFVTIYTGQARKSLWIETPQGQATHPGKQGQARKSLWIETPHRLTCLHRFLVRLVRACGSKPFRWFALVLV